MGVAGHRPVGEIVRQASHPKALGRTGWLIQASTQPGAWILDPFSGSGTTGIAANLLDRRYLGLEKEAEYLAIAKARREELEDMAIRAQYLQRLAKARHIMPAETGVAEAACADYGIPWL